MPESLPAEPVVVCATAPIRRGWAVLSGNGGAVCYVSGWPAERHGS